MFVCQGVSRKTWGVLIANRYVGDIFLHGGGEGWEGGGDNVRGVECTFLINVLYFQLFNYATFILRRNP